MSKFPSSLRLNNSPLYVYHILFMYSSITGHLGCFYLLVIVNSAAMNISVQVSVRDCDFFLFVFSLLVYLRCGSAGSYGNSMYNFLCVKNNTVFHSDYIIHIPTSHVQWFQFLHTLSNVWYWYFVVFLNSIHLNGCEVKLWFSFTFP